MKKISTIRAILLLAFLFAAGTFSLQAQTFQNTYDPTGDDSYAAGVAVSKDYWVIGSTNSFGPSKGTEHILFSRYNGTTGAVKWDRKYYSAANTKIAYTATDIQAGYGSLTPSPSTNQLPCVLTTCPVIAPSVNAVPIPKSKNYFYVSGYYKDPTFGVRRPVLIKFGNNGNIIWVRTNILTAASAYDEVGVSVESCPNGDVMLVSSVTNPGTGLTFPCVTRLDMAGVLLWRFFYTPATFQPMANLIPHQSCVFREFLTGTVNDPIGIAITGERSMPGAVATTHFVMRIKYDGTMLWTADYPFISPDGVTPSSAAWDIMLEDEAVGLPGTAENFVITGLANTTGIGATPGCKGFLSRVDVTTGGFINAHRFGIPGASFPPAPLIYGQGIYQAKGTVTNAVITGGMDDTNNGIFSDTYLLEMDITNGTVFSAHQYPLTTPNFPRTESVVSVGSGYPTPGYFISTNAFDTYGPGTLTDGHVIKTDLAGMVNSPNCHSDTLQVKIDTIKSNPVPYCIVQQCDNFAQDQLVMKKKTMAHVLCWSPFKLSAEDEARLELTDDEIAIYPNPVSGNTEIQLLFSANDDGIYHIKVYDINGKVIFEMKESFEAGDQQVGIDTRAFPGGIYLVTVDDGQQSATTKFVKMK